MTGSVSFTDTPFGKPNSTVHYSSVQCTGSESRLTNCTTNKLTFEEGKQLLKHIGVAGVSCNIECPSPLVCPTTQYTTTQCPATQYTTTQYTTTQYTTTQCPATQYTTIQYTITQYKAILYTTMHDLCSSSD